MVALQNLLLSPFKNLQANVWLVEQVEAMAQEKGCTPAQLALAWVQARDQGIVPIPGTKRRRYLEENVQAAGIELSSEDLQRLDQVAPPGAAHGQRYAEAAMAGVNR